MMFSMLLLLTLLLISIPNAHCHYGCGSDGITTEIHKNWNVKPKAPSKVTPKIEGRNGNPDDSDIFDNFRISYNTDKLEDDWSSSDDADLLAYFLDDVIPAAIDWIQKVFTVRPVDGPLTFDRTCGTKQNGYCTKVQSTYNVCGTSGVTVEDDMFSSLQICTFPGPVCENTTHPQGSGVDADLRLYFSGIDSADCSTVMGFAGFCEINSFDRPIGGFVNLCKTSIESTKVLTWEEAISLIIHEIFHVLGFNTDGFDNFRLNDEDRTPRTDVIGTKTVRGKSRAFITLPTVVEKAREFFGCDDMFGVELEDFNKNPGEASSHWDNRIMIYDVMISYVPPSVPYSDITLAVFEDSGWYKINFEYGHTPPYGRNIGCNWYQSKCIQDGDSTIDDKSFCTEQIEYQCSSAYFSKMYCSPMEYTEASNVEIPSDYQYFDESNKGGDNAYPDYCPLFEAYSNGDCRLFGANNVGTEDSDFPAAVLGGLISGTSKCMTIEGDANGVGAGCYPTQCFVNYKGEYVGTRITSYKTYEELSFMVLTCWSDDDGKEYDFPYTPTTTNNYGFTSFYCPVFDDICYKKNPWICNGHGTIDENGDCVCSPGYFGIDCTIEATNDNLEKYGDTDSVSRYIETVCDGAGWDYDDDDDNTGILYIEIENVVDSDYTEKYFQAALKNWLGVLTSINDCDIDIRDYLYNTTTTSVSCELYYHTTVDGYHEKSDNQIQSIFEKLFPSSYSLSVVEEKNSDAISPDIAIQKNNQYLMVSFVILCSIYLSFSF